MADFSRFNQLLSSNDFTALEYYTYNKYCNLVKVIHITTGSIFFITLQRSYKMLIPMDSINHYPLTREDMRNREFTTEQLSDYYPMIQLDSEYINGSEDVTGQIRVSYKQPISLHTISASEYIEQIKRLKYCFKTLEYKILLHSSQYIVNLNSENTIDIFRIENYPKTNVHSFYIVCSLEQFYSKINIIHDIVGQVESEFYNILDMNQQKHKYYLDTHYIHFFIKNNDKLVEIKKQMHTTYKEICSVLAKLERKELKFSERLSEIKNKSSHNIFKDAERVREREQLENEYNKIHELKLKLMDKILKLDTKIKHTYLVLDQLGFNLSLSFNELKNEVSRILS